MTGQMEGLFCHVNAGKSTSSSRNGLSHSLRYLEGIVHDYRNALLSSQNYSNITQSDNIDG